MLSRIKIHKKSILGLLVSVVLCSNFSEIAFAEGAEMGGHSGGSLNSGCLVTFSADSSLGSIEGSLLDSRGIQDLGECQKLAQDVVGKEIQGLRIISTNYTFSTPQATYSNTFKVNAFTKINTIP